MSTNAPRNTVPLYTPGPGPLPGQPGYQWGAGVPPYPFATFGRRLLATLLDSLIVLAIMAVPLVLGIVLMGVSTETTPGPNGTSVSTVTNGGLFTVGILLMIAAVVLAVLYEPTLTARKGAHNGQTPGRQALGIRITNLQGGSISAGQAWGRFLFASFISKNVLYLGYLWMIWDSMKQTWHDKVANTLVLDARSAPPTA